MRKICVVGIGYVGTPLLVSLIKGGFDACGYDLNRKRILELRNNIDAYSELDLSELEIIQKNVFNDLNMIKPNPSIYIITVPTPIDQHNDPDLSPLISATQLISRNLKKNDIVIYESTVYPGTTEEICIPILEESSLKLNKDFGVGYSPERLAPGIGGKKINEIIKIISASNEDTLKILEEIYGRIIDAGIYKAQSIKIAEAAKVTENIQRDVNIALVNELYMLFESLGINANDVINAASTKFNFHHYTQGLVGGHCIGVDPYYLIYKSRAHNLNPNLIEKAREVNESLIQFLFNKVITEAQNKGIDFHKIKMLFVGATFKENCSDIRNSKSLELIKKFISIGIDVEVYDPLIKDDLEGIQLITEKDIVAANSYSTIFFSVCHQEIIELGVRFFEKIHDKSMIIFDYKRIFYHD